MSKEVLYNRKENYPHNCIIEGIQPYDVQWAEGFGKHLAQDFLKEIEDLEKNKNDNSRLETLKANNLVWDTYRREYKINDRSNKYITRSLLTTSQLRKFFGEIRRIESESLTIIKNSAINIENDKNYFDKSKIILLIPKLAYAVGREKTIDSKINDFYKELKICITQIESTEHFSNFVKLVEAVVAYHKYHGGKD